MDFDKCDGGLPCMCPTTGCKKGQCARRLHPQAAWALVAATDNASALLRELDQVGAWFDERAFVVVDSHWREVE